MGRFVAYLPVGVPKDSPNCHGAKAKSIAPEVLLPAALCRLPGGALERDCFAAGDTFARTGCLTLPRPTTVGFS